MSRIPQPCTNEGGAHPLDFFSKGPKPGDWPGTTPNSPPTCFFTDRLSDDSPNNVFLYKFEMNYYSIITLIKNKQILQKSDICLIFPVHLRFKVLFLLTFYFTFTYHRTESRIPHLPLLTYIHPKKERAQRHGERKSKNR